ncbi:acetylornithine deacetylase [Castellaniella sp. S9]|uniref:acetylornithine deacetylase n=1 Tax=Castellaniella sp. S9 TaxID=2993652 RepID=UPI0022B48DB8|nr:acetylornithine deacetylase [Castellaniella sp. S9]
MKADTFDMIARLVAFDTVSRNSNLELIHFVRDTLSRHGVDSQLVPSPDGRKANLFATVGPMAEGGVVLSGHTDVVPVDGQPWDTDPFEVTRKDGRLYGRGTCDMKSFIAIALAKVPDMLRAGLRRPIHLALSHDEEVGCQGAPAMIERMAAELPKPSAVVIGEPTSMRPIMAHKGLAILRTTVTGHEAHSSQIQRGVSAVMTAAKLIGRLESMTAENRRNADPASLFVPPFSTLHAGVVHGGTAVNIISRECSFMWDVRVLPGETLSAYLDPFKRYCEELLVDMRRVAPEADIVTEVLADAPPMADEGGEAQALAQRLSGHRCCGVVPYGTEGGQFQRAGFSVVVCGPGSIDQAHQPNEYIDIEQVGACETFIDGVIAQLAA